MPTRINFGGQSVRIPGAYSQVNADALTPAVLGAFNRVGIIGPSTGGIPKTVKLYTSPVAAEADLISGRLLEGMKLMWGPSPNAAGASEILACRPEPATQSDSTIQDTEGRSAVKLTSKNYGKHTDSTVYTIDDALDGYGKKVEVFDSTLIAEVPEQNFAGLGTAFQLTRQLQPAETPGTIQYQVEIFNHVDANYKVSEFEDVGGPGPYNIYLDTTLGDIADYFQGGMLFIVSDATTSSNNKTYTIASASYHVGSSRTQLVVVETLTSELGVPDTKGLTPETHTLKVYINGSVDAELSFDLTVPAFSTVIKLIDYINNNYVGQYLVRLTGESTTSRFLDSTALDMMFSSLTPADTATPVTAHVQIFVDWMNRNSKLVSAERLAGAWIHPLDNTTNPITGAIEPVPLVGGTTPGASQTDWEDAVDKFEAEEVQLMAVMTDDLGVQLYLKNHIAYMSSQGRSERRGYYGHPLDYSVDQVKDRALALSSSRGMLLSPGVAYDVDDNDEPVIVESYYAAALVCGMIAGFSPQTPITNKQIGFIDINKVYLDNEILELLDGGVAPIKYDRIRGIFKIVQGQTTWLQDDNTVWKEDSVGRIADFISINVRRSLEDKFVGSAAEPGSAEDIRIHVTDMLRQLLKAKIITNYGDVTVLIENKIAYVDYMVAPSEPINFILITTRFQPSRLVA